MGETSYKSPATWMTDMWSSLADRRLNSVCLPGSHDSGMSVLNVSTIGSVDSNTKTQSLSVAQQLAAGARYFDLRPTMWNGTLYSGHMSDIAGWRGSAGERMTDIVTGISQFLSQASPAPSNEIIILKFSHYLDYNTGRKLSDTQIIDLMNLITDIIPSKYIVKFADRSVWLGERTLGEIRAQGNVICLFDEIYFTDPATGTFSMSTDPTMLSALAPAITFDGMPDERLLAVYCPLSEYHSSIIQFSQRLAFTYYDMDKQYWTRPAYIPTVECLAGLSASVLASKNNIYVIYASEDRTLAIVTSNDRGATWNAPQMLGGKTSHSPSTAMDSAGNIYVLFTADNNTGEILIQKITCSVQGVWSSTNGVKINEATGNAPALVWDHSTGTLCALFTKRGDSKLLFARSEPNNWSRWTGNKPINQSSGHSPDLAVDKEGNLYAVFKADNRSGKPLCTKLDAGATNWSGNVIISGLESQSVPAVAVSPTRNTVFSAFVSEDKTMIRRSRDGGDWVGMGITNLPIYDNYAESDDCDRVMKDQIGKYNAFNSVNGELFIMSWTATLGLIDTVLSSIEKLATELDAQLAPQMQKLIDDHSIGYDKKVPNVLYVDYYGSSILPVAVRINQTK